MYELPNEFPNYARLITLENLEILRKFQNWVQIYATFQSYF